MPEARAQSAARRARLIEGAIAAVALCLLNLVAIPLLAFLPDQSAEIPPAFTILGLGGFVQLLWVVPGVLGALFMRRWGIAIGIVAGAVLTGLACIPAFLLLASLEVHV